MEFDSPFDYPDGPPEWYKEQVRKKQRELREKRAGRPLGTWGGKRKGAGRPSTKIQQTPKDGLTVVLKMNNIQRMSLEEMGDGDLTKGIEALIDKYL